ELSSQQCLQSNSGLPVPKQCQTLPLLLQFFSYGPNLLFLLSLSLSHSLTHTHAHAHTHIYYNSASAAQPVTATNTHIHLRMETHTHTHTHTHTPIHLGCYLYVWHTQIISFFKNCLALSVSFT